MIKLKDYFLENLKEAPDFVSTLFMFDTIVRCDLFSDQELKELAADAFSNSFFADRNKCLSILEKYSRDPVYVGFDPDALMQPVYAKLKGNRIVKRAVNDYIRRQRRPNLLQSNVIRDFSLLITMALSQIYHLSAQTKTDYDAIEEAAFFLSMPQNMDQLLGPLTKDDRFLSDVLAKKVTYPLFAELFEISLPELVSADPFDLDKHEDYEIRSQVSQILNEVFPASDTDKSQALFPDETPFSLFGKDSSEQNTSHSTASSLSEAELNSLFDLLVEAEQMDDGTSKSELDSLQKRYNQKIQTIERICSTVYKRLDPQVKVKLGQIEEYLNPDAHVQKMEILRMLNSIRPKKLISELHDKAARYDFQQMPSRKHGIVELILSNYCKELADFSKKPFRFSNTNIAVFAWQFFLYNLSSEGEVYLEKFDSLMYQFFEQLNYHADKFDPTLQYRIDDYAHSLVYPNSMLILDMVFQGIEDPEFNEKIQRVIFKIYPELAGLHDMIFAMQSLYSYEDMLESHSMHFTPKYMDAVYEYQKVITLLLAIADPNGMAPILQPFFLSMLHKFNNFMESSPSIIQNTADRYRYLLS